MHVPKSYPPIEQLYAACGELYFTINQQISEMRELFQQNRICMGLVCRNVRIHPYKLCNGLLQTTPI